MRYYELFEATSPTDLSRTRVLYHGTKTTAAAKSIIKNGLQPPKYESKELLTPVDGMVYLTPDLGYALIYAFGGAFVGSESMKVPYRGKGKEKIDRILRGGDRYGYIFQFNGADLTAVQPDEDEVGRLWYYETHPDRPPEARYDQHGFARAWQSYIADDVKRRQVRHHLSWSMTDNQKTKIEQGEYAYYASGGKRAIKLMPDWMKAWLVECGLHVAHQGPLKPTACYRFDKTKVGWIEENGSNFFDYATKIA